MKKLHLNKAQARLLEDFLHQSRVVSYAPSEAAITMRLRELKLFGLHDEPEFEGISSPVRQYVLNSLLADAGYYDPLPAAFMTMHPGLLAQAELLEQRYRVRPMTPQEVAELDKDQEDAPSHRHKTKQSTRKGVS
jgi:hypothetical protein